MTFRRRITLTLALAVGPLLTVLGAWACRLFRESPIADLRHSISGEYWAKNRPPTQLLRDDIIYLHLPSFATRSIGTESWYLQRRGDEPPDATPAWADRPTDEYAGRETHAAGWPFLALRDLDTRPACEMQLQSTSPIRTKLVPIRRRSSFAEILDLRRPIFPGFLFTAVFWSVTAFTLLSIPATLRAARRTIRHRRDQCPTCGYTRTGLAPCPECGQPDAAHS